MRGEVREKRDKSVLQIEKRKIFGEAQCKQKRNMKTNNKETAFVAAFAAAAVGAALLRLFDRASDVQMRTVAYESQFINSTRELQQLYTKCANQC